MQNKKINAVTENRFTYEEICYLQSNHVKIFS